MYTCDFWKYGQQKITKIKNTCRCRKRNKMRKKKIRGA